MNAKYVQVRLGQSTVDSWSLEIYNARAGRRQGFKYALKELQDMSRKEDAHCRWGELYESRFRGVKNKDAKIDKILWGLTK